MLYRFELYQWVNGTSHQGLDTAIFQGDTSHCAALAVSHIHIPTMKIPKIRKATYVTMVGWDRLIPWHFSPPQGMEAQYLKSKQRLKPP